MKKVALILFAALAFSLGSCSKDSDNEGNTNTHQQEPGTVDMVNTTWEGSCNDYVTHPQAGRLPAVLKVTMDFNENKQGSVMVVLDVNGQEQAPQTADFTYEFDGLEGTIYSDGDTDHITVDPYNMTFTMEVKVPTGFSRESPQQVGGNIVFHKIH